MTALDLNALPKAQSRRRRGITAAAAAGRAVIYLRVSTDDQTTNGGSLASQEEACRALCRARGLHVAAVYTDGGYSGGTVRRPALTELREAIAGGLASVVVVYALDRLSRSQ